MKLCSRFPPTFVEESLQLCLPSILLNKESTSQSKEGPVSASHLHNFTLNVSSSSSTYTQSEVIVTWTPRAAAPIARNQPTATIGMNGFKKVLENDGVSALAATHITSSSRSVLISYYQSALEKWVS